MFGECSKGDSLSNKIALTFVRPATLEKAIETDDDDDDDAHRVGKKSSAASSSASTRHPWKKAVSCI